MTPKILLLFVTAAVFSSCSTAYKSGQTPDDVYFSPVRSVDEVQTRKNQDDDRVMSTEEIEIRMCSRDRRWRDYDYDYSYHYSPYYYSNCTCSNYGYYYNPYYNPWPVYATKIQPINSTPRKVNLNAYSGINKTNEVFNPKSPSYNGNNRNNTKTHYNNSNRSGLGEIIRTIFSSDRNSSSSSNSNRTYSPSSGSNSSNSGSSSGSGTVTRPSRGN
jgi:hypothetical protein